MHFPDRMRLVVNIAASLGADATATFKASTAAFKASNRAGHIKPC